MRLQLGNINVLQSMKLFKVPATKSEPVFGNKRQINNDCNLFIYIFTFFMTQSFSFVICVLFYVMCCVLGFWLITFDLYTTPILLLFSSVLLCSFCRCFMVGEGVHQHVICLLTSSI